VAPSHPTDEDLSVGTPAFADAQHVLVALAVHAHRADHRVIAEEEPVDVDDQQFQRLETPRQQRFHLGFGGLDRCPAHRRARHARRLRHLRDDWLVVARGNPVEQDVQHPRSHRRGVLHSRVGGNFHFLAATAFAPQAGPLDFQLALAQKHLARLATVENHVARASLALLLRAARGLHGRKLQHGLNGRSSGDVDQFVAGHLALLDQIHHGQQRLPILGQKAGQFLLVDIPLLADGAVSFLHGGSPFKVWQPDSFRIRRNRRSTCNYGWDILSKLTVRN